MFGDRPRGRLMAVKDMHQNLGLSVCKAHAGKLPSLNLNPKPLKRIRFRKAIKGFQFQGDQANMNTMQFGVEA